MRQKIVVIVGPNASGKSEFAVKLAKKINGEIISADSRQIYKKLDVGSGKVRGWWKNGVFMYRKVPHHCIDIADPKKVFTALDFKKCAQRAIYDIASRNKIPIIIGGTGFYIDAALGRVKLGGVPPDRALRKKLAGKSAPELLKMLKKIDPKRAKTIEQKNPRRLIRAIEIAKRANMRVFGKKHASPLVRWIGIKRPPEELKKRIHNRLLRRLQGIIKETRQLHKNGVSWKRLYDLGLEYRYVSLYLQSKLSKDEMIQKILTESWHYAKRQMTWFKKNKEIRWISSEKDTALVMKRT